MIRVNTEVLSALKYRFDEQITESNILKWLYNFEESDWESALTLLNQVSYYSENRCVNVLEAELIKIISNNQGLPIVFIPIGGIGKSGGVMAYYVKKVLEQKNIKDLLRENEIIYNFYNDNDVLTGIKNIVLLDDFIGSGQSALQLYKKINSSVPTGSKVNCLSVAYMNKAKECLNKVNITIYGDCHNPAFIRRGSVFGYPPKMKIIKEFALKYGCLLYTRRPYIKHMKLYIGPLGYANCQALVCFDHTTPNNTLPILWAGKKRNDNGEIWHPLFPRMVFDRIKREDDFEKRKYYWISIARKLSNGNISHIFNTYDKDSILLLGLLHCIYHKRSDSYIRILLEITNSEFVTLKENAIKKGMLTETGSISDEGRKIYLNIKKEEFKIIPLIEKNEDNKKKAVYLPKEFLGISRN